MAEESLKNKTVKGTAWSFVDNIAKQGITFLVGLVLARILTPDEYGLIGIILIFIAVFNTIIDSGFSNALIRKPNATDNDFNTVFVVNLLVSLVLFVAMLVGAPAIGHFFKQPELVPLTRAMSVILIINALSIIPRTILTKNIDFKTLAKISLISSIASGAIGIAMALMGYGVWSLVGQQISLQGLTLLFMWIWVKWRPKFTFSRESFKELFGFGWKLLASSLIDTLWKEIYQVVIGRVYTPAALGQYTRAQQFSMIFSSNLNGVVQRVSYPVLSNIQEDKIRLKEAYRKIIKTTMLVSFVCMVGLAAIAKPMIFVLIGEKWNEAVPMLQIICFNMMLYPLHAINLNMLQVQGRSDLFLKLEIIKKIIALGPLLLGIFVSIWWMLIGSVASSWICYYLNAYYSGPFLNYSIWQQIRDILPSFGVALLVGGIMFSLTFLPYSIYIIFPIQLIVGLTALLIILEKFALPEYLELKSIAASFLKKKQ